MQETYLDRYLCGHHIIHMYTHTVYMFVYVYGFRV